jgi:alkanesulfonate monooxygenase SsuD/methylene tetrahydromethanopterin reductase-like flavin-dependent oxidoreductase (luciferase family)
MAGVNVLAAPTAEEADFLFSTARLMAARIRTGRPAPLDPPVEDITTVLPADVLELTGGLHAFRAVGTAEDVVAKLDRIVAEHDLDELVVTTYTYDPELRRRSFRLLAQAWGMPARG